MSLRVSLSINATLRCYQCKRLITAAESLKDGKCSCGALLISMNAQINSLEPNNEDTDSSLSNDSAINGIALSDDEEFLTAPTNHIEEGHNTTNDFSGSSLSSKRELLELSDDDGDDEGSSTSSTNKMDDRVDALEEAIANRYDEPLPDYSDSEYQPSDGEEDELLSDASQDTQIMTQEDNEQGYQPNLAEEIAKEAKAKGAFANILSASSLPSSSSSVPAAASQYGHQPGLLQFNKEIRGQLAIENQDKSPQELTQMITDMWNKLTEEQKIVYAYKSSPYTETHVKKPLAKQRSYPGNCYMLFTSEQFPLIQKEYNIKGKQTVGIVQSIISKRWRELNPAIKEVYRQRARKMQADWRFENPVAYQARKDAIRVKYNRSRMARRGTKF